MNARKILLEAVKRLVENGKFEKMTVQDILDEAEVSRATFYKYFRDKYDITNNYYVYYASKNILSRYDGHNWPELSEDIMAFIEKNKVFFKKLLEVEGKESFAYFFEKFGKDFYINVVTDNGKRTLNKEELAEIVFMSQGGCGLIEWWVENDCDMPAKTIARLFVELTPEKHYMK